MSIQQGQDLLILCPIRTPLREWGVLALCGWSGESLTTGTGGIRFRLPCWGPRWIATLSSAR